MSRRVATIAREELGSIKHKSRLFFSAKRHPLDDLLENHKSKYSSNSYLYSGAYNPLNEPINTPDGELGGNRLLHLCVAQGKIEDIKILLEHGADPTVKNEAGESPYDFSRNLCEPENKDLANENTRAIFNLLDIHPKIQEIKRREITAAIEKEEKRVADELRELVARREIRDLESKVSAESDSLAAAAALRIASERRAAAAIAEAERRATAAIEEAERRATAAEDRAAVAMAASETPPLYRRHEFQANQDPEPPPYTEPQNQSNTAVTTTGSPIRPTATNVSTPRSPRRSHII